MAVLTGPSPAVRGLPAGLPRLTPVDRNIFPDGMKTSGQHPPIKSQIRPFEDFPTKIVGRTVWNPVDLTQDPSSWIHNLESSEIEELERTTEKFISSMDPLVSMTKAKFHLPKLASLLETVRDEILNGKGFMVLRGLPYEKWGRYKSAVATMGLSAHLGYLVSQNAQGQFLGHVTNQGHDYVNHLDKVKISRTNAPQFYHTDECDIVGLLFCAAAESGGLSGCVSAHTVWNDLRTERPDILETLTAPIWYVDRKGEVTDGQEPYIKIPIFMLEPGGQGRVYVKWDPYFVKSLSRFSSKGEIPPLSSKQLEAIDALQSYCTKHALEYNCEVGDVQFVSNSQILHARTGFVDPEPPMQPRYLLRTWVATPEHEGGWTLPFHDSTMPKRGGIQVEDQPPVAEPLIVA